MARGTSTAGSAGDWMSKGKIAVVPAAPRQPTRDYSPKGSEYPGLNEMVWKSYTTGETMVVGCPADKTDDLRLELLKARKYIEHLHRDDDEKPDIRGVGTEKTDLEIVTQEDIDAMPPAERTRYRKAIQVGWVGVRFTARPPLNKGARAARNKAVAKASTPQSRKNATVRDITDAGKGKADIKFSG